MRAPGVYHKNIAIRHDACARWTILNGSSVPAADANTVATWNMREASGGYAAEQGTNSLRPVLDEDASGANKLPGLVFDGPSGDDFLLETSGPNIGNVWTIYFVFTPATTQAADTRLMTFPSPIFALGLTATNFRFAISTFVDTGLLWVPNQINIIVMRSNGTAITARLNGVNGTGNAGTISLSGSYNICRDYSGFGEPIAGAVHEVDIFSVHHSSDEVLQMERLLGDKWRK